MLIFPLGEPTDRYEGAARSSKKNIVLLTNRKRTERSSLARTNCKNLFYANLRTDGNGRTSRLGYPDIVVIYREIFQRYKTLFYLKYVIFLF